MRGSRIAIALATGAALLAPAAARANFSEDYIAGLAALDHGEYMRAVQFLKKALEAQSEPVSRVMIEGNPQPYLPHHFLGMAQFKLGDCAAAQVEWNDPINLRMLGRLRQLRAQEEQLSEQCKPAATAITEKSTKQQNTQSVETPATTPAAAPAPTVPPSKSAPKPTPPASSPAAEGPPPALLRAYDDFVSGRYASVAKLDADALAGTHAHFQAYLLRSAARFALARSGDKGQLDAARRDARAAQALDKSVPDERVFSPAFRAFYAQAQ